MAPFEAVHNLVPSVPKFDCPGGNVASSSGKGEIFVAVHDEKDPSKYIPIRVKGAEGVQGDRAACSSACA